MEAILRRNVAHPLLYLVFIALSVLDLVFTTIILSLGGRELNVLADRLLQLAGVHGLMLLKFASIGVVLFICETLASSHTAARHRTAPLAARRLAEGAVAIAAVPVALALAQLAFVEPCAALP